MTRGSEDVLVDALTAASPRLLGYLVRHLGHREDAADALAEVLLAAWRRRRTLPAEPDVLNAWLFTAARHSIQNERRRSARATQLTARLRIELGADSAVAPDPAERTGEIDQVERVLSLLSSEVAELIRLVHWDGLTIAAAASVLDVPASTARSRYQAARARLRLHLELEADPVGTGRPE